jgi:hypothetical protein
MIGHTPSGHRFTLAPGDAQRPGSESATPGAVAAGRSLRRTANIRPNFRSPLRIQPRGRSGSFAIRAALRRASLREHRHDWSPLSQRSALALGARVLSGNFPRGMVVLPTQGAFDGNE